MNTKLATTIAAAARVARARLGLTQAQVAEQVDLSAVVYNRLECGRMLPSLSTLMRLCEALHVDPNELLGYGPSSRKGLGASTEGEAPTTLQITSLARKMDETQRQGLLTVARLLLR